MKGRRVYERQCVWCHGRSGRGDGEWAKEVKQKPRNFRTGVFKFRSTPYGSLPTDADLERTIRRGIPGTMMPSFKDMMEADRLAVIAYLKSLSPRWRDPKNKAQAEPLPSVPKWFREEEDRLAHARTGAALFATGCVSCHGVGAKGDGPAAKGLRDVWKAEIIPADLTSKSHKSGTRPEDLFRTIALGLDGTPMVGFRPALKDDAIWNLVAYIRSVEEENSTEK